LQDKTLLYDIAGRVPLFFGITGHRDIVAEDVEFLKGSVRKLLRDYRSRFQHSPIIFISALAEGVDQIAAEAALEIDGVRLAAVLPMPADEYVKDFPAPNVRSAFEHLLSRASWTHVTGYDLSDRDKLYQSCGRAIASLTHVLVVAWNRIDNGKVGGTADTVKFKLQGCIDLKAIGDADGERYLSRNETGLVYDIPIRRRSEPSVVPPGKIHWTIAAGYNEGPEAVDALLNVDKPDDAVARLIDRINSEATIPVGMAGDTRGYVSSFFQRADHLAMLYQVRSRTVIKGLFATAIIVALLNPFNQQEHSSYSILVELLAIVLMWALWYYSYKAQLKDRYEDYRSLAEAARVQIAWQDAGLKDHVADSYLSAQIGELDWLRRAIRSLHAVDVWTGRIAQDPSIVDLNLVRTNWLEKQYSYFVGAAARQPGKIWKLAKEAIRLTKYAKVFLAAGIAILGLSRLPTLGAILPPEVYSGLGLAVLDEFKWAPYLATLSLALAASLKAYGEIMGFVPVSRRYKSMALVLDRSLDAFSHIESQRLDNRIRKIQNLLLVVGKEALVENGDWIITHRQKDIKPPA
jgi:hypothetical protein